MTEDASYTATYTAHEKHPAGMEQVATDNMQLFKFIQNGQLYLIREGKMYNAQGARIK